MKKTRHTEEQIAFALQQAETGTAVSKVIRTHHLGGERRHRFAATVGIIRARRCMVRACRARAKIEAWRRDYNESRPHTSLGWLTPVEYAASAAKIAAE